MLFKGISVQIIINFHFRSLDHKMVLKGVKELECMGYDYLCMITMYEEPAKFPNPFNIYIAD